MRRGASIVILSMLGLSVGYASEAAAGGFSVLVKLATREIGRELGQASHVPIRNVQLEGLQRAGVLALEPDPPNPLLIMDEILEPEDPRREKLTSLLSEDRASLTLEEAIFVNELMAELLHRKRRVYKFQPFLMRSECDAECQFTRRFAGRLRVDQAGEGPIEFIGEADKSDVYVVQRMAERICGQKGVVLQTCLGTNADASAVTLSCGDWAFSMSPGTGVAVKAGERAFVLVDPSG